MENAKSQDRLLDNRLRSDLAAMLTNLASPPGILEHAASTTARSARLCRIVDGTPPKVARTDYEQERGFINPKVNT